MIGGWLLAVACSDILAPISNQAKSRKSARRNALTTRSRVPSFLPLKPEARASIVFYDFYGLATGGAAPQYVETFRVNDPRDPQYAVGGGTPSLFAQLALLYNKYRVESIDYDVHGYSGSAGATTLGLFFRGPNSAVPTSAVECQQVLRERPEMSVVTDCPPATTEYKPEFSLKGHRTISEIVGRDVSHDEAFSSTFAGDPAQGVYMDLILVSAAASGVSYLADAHVTITYHMICSEPNKTYTD